MIRTTLIGSQPEFEIGILRTGPDTFDSTSPSLNHDEIKKTLHDQQRINIENQLSVGLDVVAEGEMGRVDKKGVGHAYVSYIARFMSGLTSPFHQFSPSDPPLIITGRLSDLDPTIICEDWALAQSFSDRPVKINLPGPLTFATRFTNTYHRRLSECSYEFAHILNEQIHALVERGCKWIQLDDPGLTADPASAIEFGVEHINVALKGVPAATEVIIHLCRGNEYRLGGRDRETPSGPYYLPLAERLSDSLATGVSIESPHEYSNKFHLKAFGEKNIHLGIIDVNGDFPSEEHMISIIRSALNEIPSQRLFITPNCGIKHLSHKNAKKMLVSMVSAVKQVNLNLGF